jgi:hypothetical protein
LSIIRTVAPGIATAFGGPLAGMAARVVSETLLGKPDGSMKDIETVLLGASPETMLKLKEADHNFTVEMEKLGVDLERIRADDRDSARKREMTIRDRTPALLASLVFAGFFGILAALLFITIPEKSATPLNIMLGSLATIVVQIAAYYFGSSKGSAEKNRTIAGLIK